MTTTPAPVVVAEQAKKPRQKIGSEAGRAGWLVNGAMIVLCFLWLLPTIGLNLGLPGIVGSIIYAAIGAIILLFLIGLFKRVA